MQILNVKVMTAFLCNLFNFYYDKLKNVLQFFMNTILNPMGSWLFLANKMLNSLVLKTKIGMLQYKNFIFERCIFELYILISLRHMSFLLYFISK